ncbi:MAG: hypothetical protein IJS54_03080 [Desulfovibrio sp.]|nr:hypothetical protein [Desulfovibrio sp.]
MAEKRAIMVMAKGLSLASSHEAVQKFVKKAAILDKAAQEGLEDKAKALGAVSVAVQDLGASLEKDAFVCVQGGEEALAAAQEAANRRTVLVVAADDGVAFAGLGINSKAGHIGRVVSADDVVLTIATLVDLPISADCTAAIIYQVFKDPNLKLNERIKLQEALSRMESVLERNNREPWDKHDCA